MWIDFNLRRQDIKLNLTILLIINNFANYINRKKRVISQILISSLIVYVLKMELIGVPKGCFIFMIIFTKAPSSNKC